MLNPNSNIEHPMKSQTQKSILDYYQLFLPLVVIIPFQQESIYDSKSNQNGNLNGQNKLKNVF
jgi:hypothetical protein